MAGPLIAAGILAVGAKYMATNTAVNDSVYRANTATGNARSLQEEIRLTREASILEINNAARKYTAVAGAQLSAEGSSGAQVGSGSFGKISDATSFFAGEDAATIRSNAMQKAWGLRVEQGSAIAEGKMYSKKADNQMFAGFLGMGSSLFGGF